MFRLPNRWRPTTLQLRTRHPRQAVKRLKKRMPFPPQRLQFLLARWREAVVTAVSAGAIGLPAAFDQTPLLEVVEHGVKRGELELQRTLRFLFDAFGNLEAVERLLRQESEDGHFRAAARNLGPNPFRHGKYRTPLFEYSIPILLSSCQEVFSLPRPDGRPQPRDTPRNPFSDGFGNPGAEPRGSRSGS